MRRPLWYLIIFITITRLVSFIWTNQKYFLRPFDPVYISKLYSESQYVLGPQSKGGIGDDGLYAYAGYYYFFQGGDVTNVNFEHPPLGKYLIGLSIFLFKNENIINIIYFVILLLFTYQIGKLVFKNSNLAAVTCAILAFDPLFNDHLLRSMLDLPFTLFFVAAVYFFLRGLENHKFLYFSFVFWGAAFSTKFFPFMLVIFIYLLSIMILFRRSFLKFFIISSLFIPIMYLITHISFFVYHPSIVDFLRHKKWLLSWFKGAPIIAGNMLRNIFSGLYLDSTKKLVKNEYWTLHLPILTVFFIAQVKIRKFREENNYGVILYALSILYLIYLVMFTNGLHKYLMPIFPLIIILAVGNIGKIYSIITAWKRRK